MLTLNVINYYSIRIIHIINYLQLFTLKNEKQVTPQDVSRIFD